MNVDHPTTSKKRKAPAAATSVEQGDPEAPAYNEDAKARFKSLQADAEMQFEDDFEDEYDEEEVGEGMDVAENPDEEPQDDILPEETEETDPDVRLRSDACIVTFSVRIADVFSFARYGDPESINWRREST